MTPLPPIPGIHSRRCAKCGETSQINVAMSIDTVASRRITRYRVPCPTPGCGSLIDMTVRRGDENGTDREPGVGGMMSAALSRLRNRRKPS